MATDTTDATGTTTWWERTQDFFGWSAAPPQPLQAPASPSAQDKVHKTSLQQRFTASFANADDDLFHTLTTQAAATEVLMAQKGDDTDADAIEVVEVWSNANISSPNCDVALVWTLLMNKQGIFKYPLQDQVRGVTVSSGAAGNIRLIKPDMCRVVFQRHKETEAQCPGQMPVQANV
ncbi:hypothetical protein OAM67_00370 [bacterium]|nr:hypothetical protein [bacterium]